ncbi:MAG TPA: arginase family protein [Candidatus Acidoferrales bacterium]
MAVKIVRHSNKIALLGVPSSAAALSAGHEGAPAALRAAGLIDRLRSVGYEVVDLGDDPQQISKPDTESPRARNLPGVLKSVESLKPRVEQAVKSGALPLILGGDCSIALGTVAGARRYFRNIGMIYMDADADLNTPASTPSGCLDGMVVSHLTGRGAPELVRFWSEPFLVREPDLALFGVSRLDPPEEAFLTNSPLRRYLVADVKRLGPAAAAKTALDRIRGNGNEFILHFDVDVISGFGATNYPSTNGLSFEEVREALLVFAQQKNLAALEITAYNPTKDSDGDAAKKIVDLLTEVLRVRLEILREAEALVAASAPPPPAPKASAVVQDSPAPESAEPSIEPIEGVGLPEPVAGEGWSSDSLDTGVESEDEVESSRHSLEDPEDEESSDSHS